MPDSHHCFLILQFRILSSMGLLPMVPRIKTLSPFLTIRGHSAAVTFAYEKHAMTGL